MRTSGSGPEARLRPAGKRRTPRDGAAERADDRLRTLQKRLLCWYDNDRRDLPWRKTRDSYSILISEVMLQQTQVERVVPKYLEFLDRFPGFEALGAASRGDVIRAWAPLGYNRRAVRLHETARVVVDHFGGRLPSDRQRLAQLGGLGPYTSAAVACFAFDAQVATLDTNVRRVLTRLLADRFPRSGPTSRELQEQANRSLPAGQASDWNQALMDLGATICTARAPACQRCPVSSLCGGPTPVEYPCGAEGKRAAEKRPSYRADQRFNGSTRYYRGRIVDRLRSLPPGESIVLDELAESIGAGSGSRGKIWLLDLLQSLAAEGLVALQAAILDGESSESYRVGLP